MQRITEHVYVETGFRGCNASFVVTKEGVVIIDTPMMPAEAIAWRDEIARHGPVRYLINTEPHIDHFAGNHFLGGTVVGHEGTRAAILAASAEELKGMMGMLGRIDPASISLADDFSFRPPTITFSRQLTLYLGELTLQLLHLPGHTPFQAPVYIPEEGVIFTSDNVTGRLPIFRDAIPHDWLNSLERMQELEANILVPGHGEICERDYLSEMKAHIQAWLEAVGSAIKKGMSLGEAQNNISLLDRHPAVASMGPMAQQLQRQNIARLYEILS